MRIDADAAETDFLNVAYGLNVRQVREHRGMSQDELARSLAASGVPEINQSLLSRIEKGVRAPKIGEAVAIARALRVPVDVLVSEAGLVHSLLEVREQLRPMEDARAALSGAVSAYLDNRSRLRLVADMLDKLVRDNARALEDPDLASLVHAIDTLRGRVARLESETIGQIVSSAEEHFYGDDFAEADDGE